MQKVLEIREKMQKQKENEHSKAIAKRNKYKKQKIDVEREKSKIIQDMTQAIAKNISAVEIGRYNNYIDYLKNVIIQIEQNIKIAEKEVDKKREELQEAMRAKKMMEKLKEKEFEKYKQEEKLIEQGKLDEVVSYKYFK